jgi:Conjugal transfer protein
MKHIPLFMLALLTVPAWSQTPEPAAAPAATGATPAPSSAPSEPPPAASDDLLPASCRQLLVRDGSRQSILANVNVATHLRFAASVATFEVSTPGLWEASTRGSDLFIRPKTAYPAAGRTGLAVILANEQRYDFLVVAAEKVPTSCVTIHDAVVKPPPAPEPDAARVAQALIEQKAVLQRELDDRLAEMQRQVSQQAADKIKAFQYSIFTRYDWNSSLVADKALISAVYDDGRSTYIRLTTSAYGLPSISGALGDQDVLLQLQYDDLTGVVEIPGLYDQLRLRLGSHELTIKREG